MKLPYIFLLFALVISTFNCQNNTPKPVDRKEFLSGVQSEIIQQRFENCYASLSDAHATMAMLIDTPTDKNLKLAKNQVRDFYKNWKSLEWISFGPGKIGPVITIRDELSLWPIDTLKIDKRISTNDFSENDGFRETRGLMTMEYLLCNASEATIIDRLINDASYRGYLQMVNNQVKEKYMAFQNQWLESYANTFAESDGTGVSESTSLLYNAWLGSFENMKDMAILLPFGLSADAPKKSTLLLEARHSMNSKAYFTANFNQFKELFEGVGSPVKFGWKYYVNGTEGGAELNTKIDAQISRVEQAIDALPVNESFYDMIQKNELSTIESLAQEMQKLSPMIKGEMSSLMGVAITFSSSDGD